MKLKHLEIALATLLLLTHSYGQLNTADSYMRGLYTADSFSADVFRKHGYIFQFSINYLLPNLVEYIGYYLSFVWVACLLPNKYLSAQKWGKAMAAIAAGFIVTLLLFCLNYALHFPYYDDLHYRALIKKLPQATLWFAALLCYQIAKQLIQWLLGYKTQQYTKVRMRISRETAYFLMFWGALMVGCFILRAYWGVSLFLGLILPCAFLCYITILYWLIPVYWDQRSERMGFWFIMLLITLGINLPLNGIFALKATYSPVMHVFAFCVFWFGQLLLITPLSFYIHQYRKSLEAELSGLRTDLGTSTANLQFLRSQINPHFLFNALNTLYGLALTEQAERTGEGIQKLGDMMRFMLHENTLEKIALSQEIDYLRNYIDLQNMRTAASSLIKIEVDLPEVEGSYSIAPMLLIPFVENAYKHGISLREESGISISLQITNDTLQFDVHNSVHERPADDPESARSGIGLENVRQRLQLLYPQKHELVIRQKPTEFFIYLTLNLK
ncbi:sensor histidine kinase [Mucilaginibacter terrae]|uniref:Two-component system LytT family sensor kinase n=1 Tax=Mucilaginibacter terrae TaxID=1955052 RepID=A0ABU3GWS7_9SPHI|nr:histidine kinase [Mucilaginibacter terrae]MDT3404125.1 two-component system LytT family sensor kinase [Mucilaginibacter terrae]